MTHLGQRLSALIDEELEGSERERANLHLNGCGPCQEELAALWTLKRRMGALRDTGGGADLTRELLNALASTANRESSSDTPAAPPAWPDRPSSPPRRGQVGTEQRAGRYFIAGSLVVFLAGLGTAAVIAGGEPQPQAPTPPTTPSIDVMVFPHGAGSDISTQPPILRPSTVRPRPSVSALHTSHTRT